MDEWVDDGTWDPEDAEFLTQKAKEEIAARCADQNLKNKKNMDREAEKIRKEISERIAGMWPAPA